VDKEAFERIAREEFAEVPERFASKIKNVALLIEDEPDAEVRRLEDLAPEETLLGLYRGIPATERGAFYSGVLPDTITLYYLPLMEEAERIYSANRLENREVAVRLAVRETLWHEIGHYFGMSEEQIHGREDRGTNYFG
jgi:predicted Zn-dependent protease with MMP-like domain